MLTFESVMALRYPFPSRDVEFLGGNAYITEFAITNRLEETDPSWQFRIINSQTRDKQSVVTGEMTVCGVVRGNIGMTVIQTRKDGTSDANEAEKSAATDTLKRCARLFGIGRYLLELPKSVTDNTTYEQWFSRLPPKPQQQQPPVLQIAQNTPSMPVVLSNTGKMATDPLPATNSGKSITDQITHIWKPGDVREFHITGLTTKARGYGVGVFLECTTAENTIVESWTREPFRAIGLMVVGWDQSGFHLKFDPTLLMIAAFNANDDDPTKPGYWVLKNAQNVQPEPEREKVAG